jgi:hypothetical protein
MDEYVLIHKNMKSINDEHTWSEFFRKTLKTFKGEYGIEGIIDMTVLYVFVLGPFVAGFIWMLVELWK